MAEWTVVREGWNRFVCGERHGERQLCFSVKPWLRLGETGHDDIPTSKKYLGYGEFRAAYKLGETMFSPAWLRNNLNFHRNNNGALELTWSYPLTRRLLTYLQYFQWHGECLLDYNHYNNRIGIGLNSNGLAVSGVRKGRESRLKITPAVLPAETKRETNGVRRHCDFFRADRRSLPKTGMRRPSPTGR